MTTKALRGSGPRRSGSRRSGPRCARAGTVPPPPLHSLRPLLAAVLALAVGGAPLQGQGLPHPDSVVLPAAERIDDGILPSATDWGIAGGALLGGIVLDGSLRGVLGPPSPDGIHVGNALGNGRYVVSATGITWAVGWVSGQERVERIGRDATVGLAVSGIVNGLLKYGVGRARPHVLHEGELTDGGDLDFASLNDSWQAFPSGHSVVAFSVATTISEEFDDPWVSLAAYGTATFVGWSRLEERRHWVSDVVGGAIVGILATRSTRRWLHRRDAGGEAEWAPRFLVGPDGLAVSLPFR